MEIGAEFQNSRKHVAVYYDVYHAEPLNFAVRVGSYNDMYCFEKTY